MWNSVDLFTGIGGFSLALNGVCSPLLYCDNDPGVISTITERMAHGQLPRAPIVGDVRDLDAMRKIVGKKRVDLVTAGTPCVGFSTTGQMEGLANDESSLFHDAVKVIVALKPRMVLFENVSGIMRTNDSKDFRSVITTMVGAGYSLRWTTVSALEVGAPHVRRRWFCLCVKNNYRPGPICFGKQKKPWDAGARPALVVNKRDADFVQRYSMLGNAVVPLVARVAFVRLFTGFHVNTLAQFQRSMSYQDVRASSGAGAGATHSAMTTDGSIQHFAIPNHQTDGISIQIDPQHYTTSRSRRASAHRSEPVSTVLTKQIFPTPRAKMWRHSNALTKRTLQDLATVALFVSKIGGVRQQRTREGQSINIRFVEWLMGFPLDWTKAADAE